MGSGTWTTSSFNGYVSKTYNMADAATFSTSCLNANQIFTVRSLDSALNPYKIMRECRDSEEHPNTLPVILALDVTGSMGDASAKVAKALNQIMTDLYSDPDIPDVEFCIMGIGDVAYDSAPIQMSQFESDIRIAEQLDKIYFEAGGGGNLFESYSAAWYMGVNHCDLDCWKRGQKGIIITMGDEYPNPWMEKNGLIRATGDKLQADVDSDELLKIASEKFDIYHISVKDKSTSYKHRANTIDEEWGKILGDNYAVSDLNRLAATIVSFIKRNMNTTPTVVDANISVNDNGEVIW